LKTESIKYRLKLLLFIVFAFIFTYTKAQNKELLVKELNKRGEAYILIKLPDDKKTLYRLNKVVSIDRTNISKDYVHAYISKRQLNDFEELKIDYTLIQSKPTFKLATDMCADLASVKNWNCYPTYDQYLSQMNEFATNYPDLCKLDTIGTSVDGRLVLSVKISDNVAQTEEEPAFFYTSTMHGDEVAGYVLMLRLIDYLLSNYQTDSRVQQLVDNTEIWINPLANPDGTYAGGDADVADANRSNANGYDLNRNFPDPEDGEYPGGTRQKETQDMMDFMAAHYFVFSANFHGGAEVVNYPWDTWSTRHADDDWYIKISRQYADTVHANNSDYMTDFTNGITNGYDWYSISGGRQDYVNYYLHSRETTIELTTTKTPDAASLPAYWDYNYRSLLNYIDRVHHGFYGKITDTAGNPIKAKLYIENHDTDSSEIYSRPDNGMYYRMIAEGTYKLIFTAPGYNTVIKDNISIADDELIRLDIVMEKTIASIADLTENSIQIKQINNPFQDELKVNLYLNNNVQELKVSLIDLSGKQLKYLNAETANGENLLKINTADLKNGMYILQISSGSFLLNKKVIKE